MPPPLLITKASGEQEAFRAEKLRQSLLRAQVSPALADTIVDHVSKELRPGMSTAHIYRHAFSLLKQQEPIGAARYNLKKAIMELGPTGHPFEQLVGKLFEAQGFTVEVAVIVQGACVSHEVDVVAHKGERHLMVECKFHNQLGLKSDVKTALYVHARFEDIKKQWEHNPNDAHHFHEAWLVTNTKLTSDAIQYARCSGMHAVGWSHPHEGNLQHMIERMGLHPLTCLTTLTPTHHQKLLAQGLVLCKDIPTHQEALQPLRLSSIQITAVMQEIATLCKTT